MVNSTNTNGNVQLDSSSSARPDDICITGIAGSYPDSRSIQELADNLFNKKDLISGDDRRWKHSSLEIPKKTGKIWDIEKFDADFFGIGYKEAHFMDPMHRILLEKVYECIIDAGINPEELRNTRTGVYIGCFLIETDSLNHVSVLDNDYGVTASKKNVLAHRISEWLKLSAPSYITDTACSSSFYAFENAFYAIKNGDCDMALVCGANLCLHSTTSLIFARLGVLSYDGGCKCFDERANGYARSECIGAYLLQKAKDSRRIYAKVVHVKNNCDGFKSEGLHFPSYRMQARLLEDFYSESGVDPAQIEFMEAHATGTRVGDPEESNAIYNALCKNRKGPLLIGSVKSNLGHSEASSALCSVSKAVIAYNTGIIPPNINYKMPRSDIPALVDGAIKVVDEPTPWNRGYCAISGFGFGGANSHTLLENVSKSKVNQELPADNLPRLVSFSNRTENGLKNMINHLETKPIDVDEVRLWHAIFKFPERRNTYRGYILLGSNPKRSICIAKGTETKKVKRPKVCFKYSALLTNWTVIAQELMPIPVFATSLNRSFSILEKKGHSAQKFLKNTAIARQYSLLGSVAVCIALTDVLKAVGITPDYIIGEDIGELCSAYADESLTAEQTILVAYECNKALEEVFANNTVSIKQVKELLNCNLSKDLTNNLQQLIPDTATSSERWLTPSSRSKFTLSEYLIHSLANPVSLIDALSNINSHVVVIDIGFSDNVLGIPIVVNEADNVEHLLMSLGNLYLKGLDLNLAVLYPDVPFPVSQGTPMLSHLVGWNHDDNWSVTMIKNYEWDVRERDILININEIEMEFIKGHTIDGRVIYPATGYLVLVWDTFAILTARNLSEVSVVFEDVYFHRATHIPKSGIVEFNINIYNKTGQFEITENEITIVTGRIYEKPSVGKNFRSLYDTNETVNVKFNHDLNTKDVYKELNIRGYQYKGLFRGIRHCNVLGTKGTLAWNHNWVTFLDTMLQVQIINNDSRSLYVPTRIEQLAIDVNLHNGILGNCLQDCLTESLLQFKNYPRLQVIRAGGAQFRGIHITAISKKQPLGIPVYEKSSFLPNFSENISIQQAIRADIQIIIENLQLYKCKAVELVDEVYKTYNLQPIIEIVGSVMADLPLIQEELVVLSDETLTLPSNVTISNEKNSKESNALLFIGANLMSRKNIFEECKAMIKPGCFILSRECEKAEPNSCPTNFDVITEYGTGSEYLILLREKSKSINKRKYIKISVHDENYTWIEEVKAEINKNARIILYTYNEPINGLLGMVNCLRKEPGGENISGLLIADPTAPPFDPVLPFYKTQIDLGLGVNVFKNGQWGTYRHLLIEQIEQIPVNHAYLKPTVIGDVSSIKFLEGSLHHEAVSRTSEKNIVHVYCSALNFRDVMTTMGRVTVESVARNRLDQECIQGLEISGKLKNGTRIMGMTRRGITNLAESDESLLWPFPDEWTFTEAATVPVAYATVYAALVLMGKMRKGESILIHAGTGAVGQAAINVALHHGLEVFTTVGTPAKRAFIRRMFPQISDSHIGSSRDITFEEMIRRETKGEGVDLVLNSLAEEILQASAKCLKRGGRFLEIGKYDITMNTEIETCFLNKGVSFFGVMLDYLHEPGAAVWRKNIKELIIKGIKEGAVRPISYCVFEKSEMETAFRYIAAGKHIGKVVIKIRPDDPAGTITKPTFYPINAVPRYTCHRDFVYVIVGGLGGFGLELVDWLVMRGARKIVFSSRRGISNGYQALRIKFWQDYEAEIKVSTADVASEAGCQELLQLASSMGIVRAIFNLAVILRDAIFNNQTPETFKESFAPKAQATINLDKVSRVLCPELKEFVVFSSVSCGRGNAGQSNYGYSNSVMERICEIRKDDGLPALAIQWGAIGDVGLVADMQEENIQMEIGGTLQQRITSCLDAFDILLRQDATIVSSIVVAEKRTGGSGSRNVVDVIANILGITDLKTISRQVPLSEMGMDSVMAVEIKQTLERDYELFINAQEIRMLTFAKLMEIASAQSAEDASNKNQTTIDVCPDEYASILFRNFGDETLINEEYMALPSLASKDQNDNNVLSNKIMFMLPGVECAAGIFKTLCGKLKIKTIGIQVGLNVHELNEMVDKVYKIIKERLKPGDTFYITGFSFGTCLLLPLIQRLENEGYRGIVICIDGSPDMLRSTLIQLADVNDERELQKYVVATTLHSVSALGSDKFEEKLKDAETFEDMINISVASVTYKTNYSIEFLQKMGLATLARLKTVLNYNLPKVSKISSPVILIRQKANESATLNESYNLDEYTNNPVEIYKIPCDHSKIIDNLECAEIINDVLEKFVKAQVKESIKNQQNTARKRSIGTVC